MAATLRANFRVGKKELFLPAANITLLRTPLQPNFAKFRVPLTFSKLDLRDYLFHVYGVEIRSVRSYIKQQRVRNQDSKTDKPVRRWHRPRSHKHMTVELVQPFRWPAEPESYAPWSSEEVDESNKEDEQRAETRAPTRDTVVNEERRERMKEQALELLKGKKKWVPPVEGPGAAFLRTRL